MVVPTFNEKEQLHRLISDTRNFFKVTDFNYELLDVDDGSTDGSSQLVDSLAYRHHFLRIIQLEKNNEISAALKAGFSATRNDLIFYKDSDLLTALVYP